MTGATQLNMELGPKRLELMHQLLPKATAHRSHRQPHEILWWPKSTSRDAREAARALGLQLQILQASTEDEFDKAVANLPKTHCGTRHRRWRCFLPERDCKDLPAITGSPRRAGNLQRARIRGGGRFAQLPEAASPRSLSSRRHLHTAGS